MSDALDAIENQVAAFGIELNDRFNVQASSFSAHVDRLERVLNDLGSRLSAVAESHDGLAREVSGFKVRIKERVEHVAQLAASAAEVATQQLGDHDDRLAGLRHELEALSAAVDVAGQQVTQRAQAADDATAALTLRVQAVEGLVGLMAGNLAPPAAEAPKPVRAGTTKRGGS